MYIYYNYTCSDIFPSVLILPFESWLRIHIVAKAAKPAFKVLLGAKLQPITFRSSASGSLISQ